MAGDMGLARSLIIKADLPEVAQFYRIIVGKTDPDVHWQSKQPTVIPRSDRAALRMPSIKEQVAVFESDGWRCRYCGTRIIARAARAVLSKAFPDETRLGEPSS